MTEQTPTLSDCQHDAVLLHGMLEAIDFIENEGACDGGRTALVMIAVQRSRQLISDLEMVEARLSKKR